MSFLEELYQVANRDTAKGRIFKQCLDKELSFSDIEDLAVINKQTAFTARSVEKILDVIQR